MKYGDYSHKEPVVVFDKLLNKQIRKYMKVELGISPKEISACLQVLYHPDLTYTQSFGNTSSCSQVAFFEHLLVEDVSLLYKRMGSLAKRLTETVGECITVGKVLKVFKDAEGQLVEHLEALQEQAVDQVFVQQSEDVLRVCGLPTAKLGLFQSFFAGDFKDTRDKKKMQARWKKYSVYKKEHRILGKAELGLIEKHKGQVLTFSKEGLQIEPLYTPLNWELLDRYVQTKT
jgi:hypothetical protein